MSELINIHKAKTHLSRLLARAHAGEEIILARAGKPYARLMPLEKAERRLGFMEGRVDDGFFDALPAEELDSWEGR